MKAYLINYVSRTGDVVTKYFKHTVDVFVYLYITVVA